LINLLEDAVLDAPVCTGIKKNGVACTNKAKWMDETDLAFCEIHLTSENATLISKKLKCRMCALPARYKTTEEEGLCEKHNVGEISERWYTVDNINDLELRVLLFKKLDKYNFKELGVNTVLIEKQPKMATEKMRALAYAIYDYFIIKFEYSVCIEWIDPKNKLYVYSGPVITCPIKNQYDRNKWFACKYCEWNLSEKKETIFEEFFQSNKKKDDLADCYLQGLFYAEKKGKNNSMSLQQRNIYTEQNLIKYAKVKARKPKKLGQKIMLAGIKYYIRRREITDAVKSSITYYFGDIAIEKLF
jgi:hypothetical protein